MNGQFGTLPPQMNPFQDEEETRRRIAHAKKMQFQAQAKPVVPTVPPTVGLPTPRGQKLRDLRPLAPPKPLGAAVAPEARPPEWTDGEALPNVPQKAPRGGIEEGHARSTL